MKLRKLTHAVSLCFDGSRHGGTRAEDFIIHPAYLRTGSSAKADKNLIFSN